MVEHRYHGTGYPCLMVEYRYHGTGYQCLMVEHRYHGTIHHELDIRDSRWNTVILRGEFLSCLQTGLRGELILPSCSKNNKVK